MKTMKICVVVLATFFMTILNGCKNVPVNYKLITPPHSVPRVDIYPNQTVPEGIIVSDTVKVATWKVFCPAGTLPSNAVSTQCLAPTFTGIPQDASEYTFTIVLDSVDCNGMKEGQHPILRCEEK